MTTELIFTNHTYLTATIISLLAFFFSAQYSTKNEIVNKAVLFCFAGFAFCFLSSLFVYLSAYTTFSTATTLLIELSLLLIGLCFFIAFSTQLLLGERPAFNIILLVLTCGFVLIVTFLFFAPSGEMVEKIRGLFPFAGFCYLAVTFFAKSNKKKFSYILAAMISSYVSMLYLNEVFPIDIPQYKAIPIIVYSSMAVVFLLMRSEELHSRLLGFQKSLEINNNKLKEIIDHSPFPIIISRLSDDSLLIANENAANLFGIYKKDLPKYKLKDFFAEQSARKDLAVLLEKNTNIKDFEFLSDTQNAFSPFWLLASASIIEYNLTPALYMAFQDITTRKNKEFILEDQAFRDPLTGIFNRRYFEEEVAKRIKQSQKQDKDYTVLMLDADHFKNVNDTFGHKTGDNVLIKLASMANKALRDSDIVARFGGEEFVMFLADTDEAQGIAVANRLRESISKIIVASEDNRDVKLTVSIGLCSSNNATDLSKLVKNADLALYKAKENGRNRVEVYVKDFDRDAVKLADKIAKHSHPVYEKEKEEEISLLDENIITNKEIDNDM